MKTKNFLKYICENILYTGNFLSGYLDVQRNPVNVTFRY
jgi:hypothetical protein